jgi:hypothetical protein
VVLKCFKQVGTDFAWYLQVDMGKAIVDSIQIPGDENSPTSASFNYGTLAVSYQNPTHTNAELDGSGPDDWAYSSEGSGTPDRPD